jgi:hypothetical protein
MSLGQLAARLTGQAERPVGACSKCGHGTLLSQGTGLLSKFFRNGFFSRTLGVPVPQHAQGDPATASPFGRVEHLE